MSCHAMSLLFVSFNLYYEHFPCFRRWAVFPARCFSYWCICRTLACLDLYS
ncbi:hypothetical protein AG1IA_03506 [Rhizoctonia solani AG-1 IA]|uniref:Uncharacterized protein n=1 Tax=Thanatephorus cucumeris (strain AG1-IA) TaxID=983506 RepID=L8WWM0_THACA|nr:hypothetical protein AG1IA_03506 [Rhizoctonia solani AG-1 IA]